MVDIGAVAIGLSATIDGGLEQTARFLESTGSYRVLRRLPPPHEYGNERIFTDLCVGLVVDCETSSFDQATMEPIEICLLPFVYDPADGSFLGVLPHYHGYQEPTRPITEEATALHKITNDIVAGRLFDLTEVYRLADLCNVVIAHHAGFDRKHFEKLAPIFTSKPWICSLEGIDWKARGARRRDLQSIVESDGFFYDAHGAVEDCRACLSAIFRGDRFIELRKAGRAVTWHVFAKDTNYALKDRLKDRGYFWNDGADGRPKCWHREIAFDAMPDEEKWLMENIYKRIAIEDLPIEWREVTAFNRYTSRG